jgi:protein tyrosine/serine phosphatase
MKNNVLKYGFLVRVGVVLALVVSSYSLAVAQDVVPQDNGNAEFSTKIKNFGQMNERFYRGAQPKESDYQSLAALGIKTVIDLRDNPTEYEKREVEALGMKYVNIPMSDKDYPQAEQIATFLKLTDQAETGKFFVHCAGGRHRTGVMGAVYRFTHDKWNYDKVYAEMKRYDFYSRWGHGPMKKYVQDYWQQLQSAPAATVNVATQEK